MSQQTTKSKTRKGVLAAAVLMTGVASSPAMATCGQDDYIGGVCLTAISFCPRGTIAAEGQLLAVSQYSALFSLYGTTFGGDGRTTFGLPDLRGRGVVGTGQGPGLSMIRVGQKAGATSVTLTQQTMPAHSHTATTTVSIKAHNLDEADAHDPAGVILGDPEAGKTGDRDIYSSLPPNATLNATAAVAATQLQANGGNQTMSITSPYLGMRYCVATQGLFPPRN